MAATLLLHAAHHAAHHHHHNHHTTINVSQNPSNISTNQPVVVRSCAHKTTQCFISLGMGSFIFGAIFVGVTSGQDCFSSHPDEFSFCMNPEIITCGVVSVVSCIAGIISYRYE